MFENGAAKSPMTIYNITLHNGQSATMLSMAGADLAEATESAIARFRAHRVKSVEVKVMTRKNKGGD